MRHPDAESAPRARSPNGTKRGRRPPLLRSVTKILPAEQSSLEYWCRMEQSPHILFVEDDPDIRSLVADFLEHNGYRLSVARDGREMDRVLGVSRIDLLILDIML